MLDESSISTYSYPLFGAGITQLAECQLPKLNVAGSTPVARSILIILLLLLSSAAMSQSQEDPAWRWLLASGEGLSSSIEDAPEYPSMQTLTNQIENGNRSILIPLVWILVRSGRMETGEAWMEGRGWFVPASRRDLAIALSWYGRYGLYDILSSGTVVPPDLTDDDYGPSIAGVIALGWMSTAPDGFFHPDILAGPDDLDRIAGTFFGDSYERWDRTWIGISELDDLFHSGSYGSGR